MNSKPRPQNEILVIFIREYPPPPPRCLCDTGHLESNRHTLNSSLSVSCFELVCSGRGLTYVNSRLFRSARNGISFFEFSVHQDPSTVQKTLMNVDVSFSVRLTTSDGTTMEKRFGIETNYTSRTKRGLELGWSPWSYWSIHLPHLFRNYNQHLCCGCYSGCGAVAWAQIFAYYDRYKTGSFEFFTFV